MKFHFRISEMIFESTFLLREINSLRNLKWHNYFGIMKFLGIAKYYRHALWVQVEYELG